MDSDFFFEQIKTIQETWERRFQSVPLSEDLASKLVSNKRLDKYGELLLIDQMVRTYAGAYTHDDIFNLTVVEVYNFKLMQMELNYLEEAKSKVRQQEAKQKRKK